MLAPRREWLRLAKSLKSYPTPTRSAERMERLPAAVAAARQIALLWDTTSGTSQVEATRAAAQASAIRIQLVPITNWDGLGATLNATLSESQALVALSSPTVFQHSARLAGFTRQRRMPAIAPFRPFAEAGGLMSSGPDLQLYFQRTAFTIDRIVRGARPADVAIEQTTQFELVINVKTAKALGLTMPQSLLLRVRTSWFSSYVVPLPAMIGDVLYDAMDGIVNSVTKVRRSLRHFRGLTIFS